MTDMWPEGVAAPLPRPACQRLNSSLSSVMPIFQLSMPAPPYFNLENIESPDTTAVGPDSILLLLINN